jgi:5'-deoxynucleotidase YfbR-like HD superfamily hydrolase
VTQILSPSLPKFAYRTHMGHMLDISKPEAITFDLEDIAHNLARICRFGGAVDEYYSVASHSVYVAREVERANHPLHVVRGALLHDATEAYLGDMVSGLKRMMPEYRALERRYAQAIEAQYGVAFDGVAAIKDADLRARLSEIRDLFVERPYPRELLLGGEGDRVAFATTVVSAPPDAAEWDFLAMARRLGLFS